MVSKNDLSAFKLKPKNTLEKIQHSQEIKAPEPSVKAWRKPLPNAEKQTELVGLRFTLSELEAIKTQAWLVPLATYLKHIIKNSRPNGW